MNSKKAVITGASKGIGYSIAKKFLNEGYEVINLSRTNCDLVGVQNIYCDLGNINESFFKELEPHLKNISSLSLVHNAAYYSSDSVIICDIENLRKLLEINLIGPAILNKMIIPYMKESSSIIYIGSTLSHKSVANQYSYSISKHALLGMMRSTCQDLFGKKIHTLCICPGFTGTEMVLKRVRNDSLALEAINNLVSEARLINPIEIAECVYFSSQNSVLNGSVIDANLGQKEF